jgi:hypothetical protein
MVQQTLAADYMVIDDNIYMEGEIKEGEFKRFETFLSRAQRKVTTVYLAQSGGGVLDEALAIGRYIRRNKMDTVVAPDGGTYKSGTSRIASATAIIYLGGVNRRIDLRKKSFPPSAKLLGFHPVRVQSERYTTDSIRPMAKEKTQVIAQVAMLELYRYKATMIGVEEAKLLTDWIFSRAMSVGNRDGFEITWLTIEQCKEWNIVNADALLK